MNKMICILCRWTECFHCRETSVLSKWSQIKRALLELWKFCQPCSAFSVTLSMSAHSVEISSIRFSSPSHPPFPSVSRANTDVQNSSTYTLPCSSMIAKMIFFLYELLFAATFLTNAFKNCECQFPLNRPLQTNNC